MLVLALSMVLAVPAPTEPQAFYDRMCGTVAAAYDTARGGFASKRGLPSESAVELAFALGRERASGDWTARALATSEWIRSLRDTVGGGFFHASSDADPNTTRFEKRTDSNARRLETLILAWRASGDEKWRREATRVVDYFDRVLLDGRGGFIAGQIGSRDLEPEANGFAIHAWLEWAAASRDPRYRDFALKSLDRTWAVCWNSSFGMLRRGSFGELLEQPQLVDQVEIGRAFVLGARYGGRAIDLQRARGIGDLLLARFEDREKGGLRIQAVLKKNGETKKAARVREENARAALFLAELAVVTGDPRYRAAAQRTCDAFADDLDKAGLEAADWALASRMIVHPALPPRPEWKVIAVKAPARRRSTSFMTGRR